MPKNINLVGKKFGRLTVVELHHTHKKIGKYWLCKCDCGNINIVCTNNLNTKNTISCGCYHIERAIESNQKQNIYNLSRNYGTGYDTNNIEFYFDLEDYDLIKNYCWVLDANGYVVSESNQTSPSRILMHRIVMGNPEKMDIDHINRIKNDNRKQNLRISTHMENCRNRKINKNNTTGILGVHKTNNNSWHSRIMNNYIAINLGTYNNLNDAIYARLLAEKQYFGEFAPQRHLFEEYGIE